MKISLFLINEKSFKLLTTNILRNFNWQAPQTLLFWLLISDILMSPVPDEAVWAVYSCAGPVWCVIINHSESIIEAIVPDDQRK